MIILDGSIGEGGGQILRTSLAMSLVTGKPFRIENIRAGRKKPGLMRQHLTAVNAASEVGSSNVTGASIGSQSLEFAPKTIKHGSYSFAIGTAGSCTLVLQTILPALLMADGQSEITLEGGTHNPYAPPYDFLAKSFLPLINRMGPDISIELERPGFYPAGGGKFRVTVKPSGKLARIDILERGEIKKKTARAVVAQLSPKIGERELKIIGEKMGWQKDSLLVEEVHKSQGPGNVLIIEVESENITEVITGFGEIGVLAENIAEKTAKSALKYLAANVPIGHYLADQLLIPMTMAGGGKFRTMPPSRHTMTNIEVLKKFVDVEVKVDKNSDNTYEIEIIRR